ncbi:MAG: histidine kinase [Syntrophomonadaceae bacterium]|jgi:two-component system sensor histidine kinase YesM|nr:histidine kinase [Syntrophomonadaceae bacterium]
MKEVRVSGSNGRSLKNILFLSNAKTIFVLILLLFVSTAVYIANDRMNYVTELQTNLCASMINAIESSVETMSIVSMNVLYSQVIREKLKTADPGSLNIRQMEPIYDAIASIIGPYGTVTQVNLHSNRDFQVGWGVYELCGPEEYKHIEDYDEILKKRGFKYFGVPRRRPDLAYYNHYLNSKKFISLYRMYFGVYYEENGIVEIIQDCDTFFSYLNSAKTDNPNLKFYAYDEKNRLVYPYQDGGLTSPELAAELAKLEGPPNGVVTRFMNLGFVSYAILDNINWKIVAVQNPLDILAPISWFLALYLFIGLVFLGILVFVCYNIADRVSTPIFDLMKCMEAIDLSNIIDHNALFEKPDCRIDEFVMLADVFEDMYQRLYKSTRELMSSKTEEIRAKMIATQSMVNPHFIFNNLANISIMAEENMNEQIGVLCRNLCDYLRYVSADSLTTVCVSSEIYYTEKYLECMKIRYGKRLEYSFEIPRELETIKVSKLTLQPIIENALKYAFQNKPPWILKIAGRVDERGWEISVTDNGVGIRDEYLKEILENQRRIRETKDISAMRIGGMGLANVYLRLILLHGEDTALLLESPESGGTKVIVRCRGESGV